MLTASELSGTEALLRLMPVEDVLSLAKTIVCGQIAVNNFDEAVRAVGSYSKTAVELLKRRKLKRELLFQYLHHQNVAIDPKTGKMQLAKRILEHWGTQNVDILDLMEIGEGRSPLESAPSAFPGPAGLHGLPSGGSSFAPLPNLIQDIPPQLHNQSYPGQHQVQGQAGFLASAPVAPSGGGEAWLADFLNFENAIQANADDVQMGTEFASWFYRMINACNPQGQRFDTPLSTQHFFPDCQLKVAIINSNELETYSGADAICQKFLDLTQQDLVIFNPNIDSGGIKCLATPHGLKIFLICGTLHKSGDMVGVFAQQFGLIRNPDQNFNWNIKFSNLKLIAGKPQQQPTLDNPGNVQPLQQ